jgi:hypothetical protein
MLLEQLGAAGARVQTKAAGDTKDLSFRDLGDYALIEEAKIQARTSPVLTGQYNLKTPETAVFKYVLTGVDDSALDMAKPETSQPVRQAVQLELSTSRFATSTRKLPKPITTRRNWKS